MQIGNVVVIKADNRLMGEVLELDDMDRAKVKLCESGVEIWVDMADLYCTGCTQPHRESGKVVHILGTEYKILIVEEDDYRFSKDADGWLDPSVKEILIYNHVQDENSMRDLVEYQKKVLRHEIVHAFLYESGLWSNAYGSKCWAQNEEMVDWIAIQEEKIHSAYIEADCV